ncbi:MAG: SigE family RNA polymerase sigma factor [Streptosporangiaceae bacterium]
MEGDRHEDFRAYVLARSATLLRTAYLLTGHRADAEDLLQTALAKTYLAWGRIHDRGSIDAYVRRAMVNTHVSWWRRRKVDTFATETVPERPTDDPSEQSVLHDAMWTALGRLPRRQRAVVVLRYYEDLTEAEIGDVLGVSVGTVKSTLSRGVAKLRKDVGLREDVGLPEASSESTS